MGGRSIMSFERKVLVATLASLGIVALGGPRANAAAQDANASQNTSKSDASSDAKTSKKDSNQEELVQTLETITVTGYTRSVETSVDLQRFSDKIENVVTAADIGGLPDQSIADALTRLPGVSAERIGGEASQINIRGLSGNFIQTTLDGRVQPSTSGSNYIQFDDYPSELINQVAVYKSSQADIIEGGIGGTIAMQTANPLDNKKAQSLNVDARGSYNSRAKQIYGDGAYNYRVSAAYQGKFFDDTLGVGLGLAQLSQPHVSEQFVNESYGTTLQAIGSRQAYVNSGIQLNQDGGSETRHGYMGTLVWKPNEHFQLKGDAFYSHYDAESYQQGLRAQVFGSGDITNPVIASNGALIGGTVSSIPGGAFGIPGLQAFSVETTDNNQSTESGVFSGGLNAQWNQGPWTVTADLSTSHANSYTVGSDVTADAFNGLGTANPLIADQSVSFLLHGLNVGQFSVANPGMYTSLNNEALDAYGMYPTSYHDRMKAFSTSVTYRLPDNPVLYAVEAGIYGQNHTYDAARSVWTYGSDYGEYPWASPTQPPLALNSSDAHVACWSGSEFGGYPCFLAINGDAVLAANGITPHPTKQWAQNWTFQQSGEVDEKIRDGFVQADIDTTLLGRELTGNVGVRFVHTSQYSPGLDDVGNGEGVPITDGVGVTNSDFLPVNPGQSYNDVLPSLNLNYRLDGQNQLRFAVAKVMSRPPIDLLKSGTASWISGGNTYNLYAGSNPLLDPMYATQYDLAFSHYFDHSSGVVGADVFYKHIDSFVQTITDNNFDFAGAGFKVPTNPATGQPYLNGEYMTAYNNTQGGYVRGIELQFQKTDFLPGIWSGLGVSADYAYTQSNVEVPSDLGGFPQQQALPGLSKNVADAALFFDYARFSTRLAANYRSPFVSASQVSFNFQTVYFAAETVVDYQASYNFTKHLSALFQVLNLTDQPTQTYFGNPTETSTIQYFGRTYYFGLNFSL